MRKSFIKNSFIKNSFMKNPLLKQYPSIKRNIATTSIKPDKEYINFLISCGVSFSACFFLISQQVSEENNLENIYSTISPSVVTIKTSGFRKDPFNNDSLLEFPLASGTGFVMFDDTHVVTSAHVIEGSSLIKVNDEEVIPEIVNIKNDIAILKTRNKTNIKTLKACTSKGKIGRRVVAIGNPFGLEGSMSEGIISGKDRYMYNQDLGINIGGLLQTDAAINPGNSGGPLIDINEKCVIGMNTSIISPSGANSGVGLAIPIDKIIDVYNTNNNNNNNTDVVLGLILAPDIYNEMLGIKGVIVSDVVDGSISDNLGIQGTKRDDFGRPIIGDIITKINNKIVKKNEDILSIVSNLKHGDIITLEVTKNDKKEVLSINV